jgi:hypothetical protein
MEKKKKKKKEPKLCVGFRPKDGHVDQIVPAIEEWGKFKSRPDLYEPVFTSPNYVA